MSLAQRYRVVGIDPSLTATGLCLLQSAQPGDYRVTACGTVRTNEKQPMLDRLRRLQDGVTFFLQDHAYDGDTEKAAIVIEDPTRQHATRTKRQNPATIALLGLAVGTVLAATLRYRGLMPVAFLDVECWMPKRLTGRLQHIMARDEMMGFLRDRITIPEGESEHVLFAAGVARFWIEEQRRVARLSA